MKEKTRVATAEHFSCLCWIEVPDAAEKVNVLAVGATNGHIYLLSPKWKVMFGHIELPVSDTDDRRATTQWFSSSLEFIGELFDMAFQQSIHAGRRIVLHRPSAEHSTVPRSSPLVRSSAEQTLGILRSSTVDHRDVPSR